MLRLEWKRNYSNRTRNAKFFLFLVAIIRNGKVSYISYNLYMIILIGKESKILSDKSDIDCKVTVKVKLPLTLSLSPHINILISFIICVLVYNGL